LQAHIASVTSPEQVEAVMGRLLENNKIQRASHNILAYRIYNAATDAFLQVRTNLASEGSWRVGGVAGSLKGGATDQRLLPTPKDDPNLWPM
jgi:hypothetical protein